MKIQIFVLTFILGVNAEHNAKAGIGYGGLDKFSKTYDRNRSNFYVTDSFSCGQKFENLNKLFAYCSLKQRKIEIRLVQVTEDLAFNWKTMMDIKTVSHFLSSYSYNNRQSPKAVLATMIHYNQLFNIE